MTFENFAILQHCLSNNFVSSRFLKRFILTSKKPPKAGLRPECTVCFIYVNRLSRPAPLDRMILEGLLSLKKINGVGADFFLT